MADDFAISVGTPDRVLSAQIRQVFNDSLVNDIDPADIGALATPVAVTSSISVQPSISGTSFAAIYSNVITGTGSRFLTQLTTSTRVQLLTSTGFRHNGGLITAITNDTSATMTNLHAASNTAISVLPLDTGSPTTGTTIITQTSNLAFSGISSGNYLIICSAGILGPYNMTLTDSNFALSFSYDSAYFNWATSSATYLEVSNGVSLVPTSGISSGSAFYLTTDRMLRIAP